jgi:PAS domain S-box-containing protein
LSSAVFGLDGDSAGTTLPSELRFAMRFLVTAIGVTVAASLDILAGPGMQAMFYLPAILLVTLLAGWQAGVASCVASILVSWSLAMPLRGTDMHLDFFAAVAIVVLGVAILVRRILVEMKLTEARLRSLVEASSNMVFTTDSTGHIRELHPGLSGVTGVNWDEYRGRSWRDLVHPEEAAILPQGPLDGSQSVHLELRLHDPATKDWRWYRVRALPLTGYDGMVREWVGSLSDIHEARLAREQRELLVEELRHRMKNLVTVIVGLAKTSRSGRHAEVEEFLKRFLGRLYTLGTAADIVLASNRVSIETGAVIRATLSPFGEPARFHIEGPQLHLSEQTGAALAMAVHELATNALKYGALSVPEGSVSIVWSCTPVEDGERVNFEWIERGGPPTMAPEKPGVGTRIIGFVPQHEKAGEVKLDYRREGLYCRIQFTKAAGKTESAARANSATLL